MFSQGFRISEDCTLLLALVSLEKHFIHSRWLVFLSSLFKQKSKNSQIAVRLLKMEGSTEFTIHTKSQIICLYGLLPDVWSIFRFALFLEFLVLLSCIHRGLFCQVWKHLRTKRIYLHLLRTLCYRNAP
jgi:hypothetical protein